MTANELRYNILLGVDSLFEGTAPGYNNRQMSSIINRAQRRIFRNKAILFDSNEKVKRMLAPVTGRATVGNGTITATVNPAITDYPHETSLLVSEFYTLPDKVAFIVEESVRLDDGTDVGDPIIVFPITYDYFTKNYKSRYKKPHNKLIWRMDAQLDSGNPCVELIFPTGYTIDDYFMAYLRYPTDITVDVQNPGGQVDCEIPDSSFQDEIVAEAIKIITASLDEGGYQVANAEANFDEN